MIAHKVPTGAVLLLALLLVAVPAYAGSVNNSVVQSFSEPLQPYNAASTPQGYLFGTGTWSGSVDSGFTRMNFTVALSGAMPDTKYGVEVTFTNATGATTTRTYGVLTTDAGGSGAFSASSQIFHGSVSVGLFLADKTNFSPPLQVLTADPAIGSDVVT